MKYIKSFSLVVFLLFIVIFSCTPLTQKNDAIEIPKPIWDENISGSFPPFRIDLPISKISIFGSGYSPDDIKFLLTDIFHYTLLPIKVIEVGNIKSILNGKIIEYETGLTKEESQKIAQMLQVDHLLFFDEKITPHNEYLYGGRFDVVISLKIIRPIDGEIVFQTQSNFGAYLPERVQSHWEKVSREVIKYAELHCMQSIVFTLLYAFGDIHPGFILENNVSNVPPIVKNVMLNSPAHNAGIRDGDRIIEVNGKKVENSFQYRKILREDRREK